MWRPPCVPAPPHRPQLAPPGGARPAAPGAAGRWGRRAGRGRGLRGRGDRSTPTLGLGQPPRFRTLEDLEMPSGYLATPDHSLVSSGGHCCPSLLTRSPTIAGSRCTPACSHGVPGDRCLTATVLDSSEHHVRSSTAPNHPGCPTPRPRYLRGPRFPRYPGRTRPDPVAPEPPILPLSILGNPCYPHEFPQKACSPMAHVPPESPPQVPRGPQFPSSQFTTDPECPGVPSDHGQTPPRTSAHLPGDF